MIDRRSLAAYHYSEAEWQALLPWVGRSIPVPPAPVRTGAAAAGAEVPRDRIRGMLLGLAIGDSLGNTSEGMRPVERRRVHGEVRDYLPNRREEMLPVGLPSDDSQLSFWTLESLLRRGYLDPADLAETFTRQHRIFGIGSTVTDFLLAYRFGSKAWFEAGQPSAGNGALMRIAPVLLPHLRSMTEALWVDVVAATVLTHRDEAAVVASVGFVGLLAECLTWPEGGTPPAPWWPETFLRYARPAEAAPVAATGAVRGAAAAPEVPAAPFIARGSPEMVSGAACASGSSKRYSRPSTGARAFWRRRSAGTRAPTYWRRCPASSIYWPAMGEIPKKRSCAR